MLCTTTRRCASGSLRNPLQVLTASPAAAVEVMAAKVAAPQGQHPRRRIQRLLLPTPRAPVLQWPHRQPFAAADVTSPTAPSPTRTQSPKRTHQATRGRRSMRAPLGRAPVTSHTNTVADIMPVSPTMPLSHQHVPVSVIFLILVFSQINYFCCKTHVPVII